MTFKKVGIGVASLALALGPAVAQASPGGGHGKPEATHGKGPTQRSESGTEHAGGAKNRGKSNHGEGKAGGNRCAPHAVAYIASGTLVTDTLTKDEKASTYSGPVTVEVSHTNHNARAALGETETYALKEVRVSGPLSVEELAKGDRVKLIGKITTVARKCESSTFTPTTTISKLVAHAPKPSSNASTH